MSAVDDGLYRDSIDPLGGQWRVERIGKDGFRAYEASITFSGGGFLNHGAGCRGGHPAFYRLEGQQLTITRREAVQIGKCGTITPAGQAAAAAGERRLARFLDQVIGWERPDKRTLLLRAGDGSRALLSRPVEPYPDLAGRWIIDSIGGRKFETERRPPLLSISTGMISVVADCNRMGVPFQVPAPGRIAVTAPIIGTQIGCSPEDSAEDSLMTRAVASASAYRLEGDRLIITGGPGIVLRRPAAPDRSLVGDYAACGNTLLGAYHDGPITLAVDARTVRDNAGCRAEYRATGPDLTLRLGNAPACAAPAPRYVAGEPVPIGGAISPLAVTRPDGFAFDEEGRLILRTMRGLLTMCRQGSPVPFGG